MGVIGLVTLTPEDAVRFAGDVEPFMSSPLPSKLMPDVSMVGKLEDVEGQPSVWEKGLYRSALPRKLRFSNWCESMVPLLESVSEWDCFDSDRNNRGTAAREDGVQVTTEVWKAQSRL